MNYTQLINKTEDYIEAHLNESIRLNDIADAIGISTFHFHRIFKEHTSETLHQFISRIKMERSAIILITNSNITVTELAHRYGYHDASSYNRSFKRHFNMTPTQFKNSKK